MGGVNARASCCETDHYEVQNEPVEQAVGGKGGIRRGLGYVSRE